MPDNEEIRAWLGRVIRDLPQHALPELVSAVRGLQMHYFRPEEIEHVPRTTGGTTTPPAAAHATSGTPVQQKPRHATHATSEQRKPN
jgi:hypothetical protein